MTPRIEINQAGCPHILKKWSFPDDFYTNYRATAEEVYVACVRSNPSHQLHRGWLDGQEEMWG